jgi:hypothetical protein
MPYHFKLKKSQFFAFLSTLLLLSFSKAEAISPDDFIFTGPAPTQLGEQYEFTTYVKRENYPKHSVYFYAKTANNSFSSNLPKISGASASLRYTANDVSNKATMNNNYSLGYVFTESAKSYKKIELSYMRFNVADNFSATAGALRLNSSTTDLYTLTAGSSIKCFIWQGGHKSCAGYQLAYDNLPVFAFEQYHRSSENVTITNLKDLEAGLHVNYRKEFESEISIDTELTFNYGLGFQQARNIKTSGAQILGLRASVSYPWDEFEIKAALDGVSATIPVTNGIENWTSKSDTYSLMLGAGWGF